MSEEKYLELGEGSCSQIYDDISGKEKGCLIIDG